jgi:hypothetical protein
MAITEAESEKVLKQAQHDRKRLDQLEPQVADLLVRVGELEGLVSKLVSTSTLALEDEDEESPEDDSPGSGEVPGL